MKKILLLLGTLPLLFIPASQANISNSRLFDFNYQIVFKGLEDVPAESNQFDLWVPHLPDTPHQQVEKVTITPEGIATITNDEVYDNKIIHFTFKPPIDPNLEININYKIRRLEFANKNEAANGTMSAAKDDFSKYLKANRLVTISPRIEDMAANVTKGKTTTLEKARAIYDYVFDNVAYNKKIPGYGQGDTERVCNIKAGNCTDFHSLFISLSRASDIPAKFVIGVPIAKDEEGELGHYHCWAEFYDEQLGWVPVDISEAWKDKTKKEYHFGAIDEGRLEFSRGRDIVLNPAQKGDPLNYFIYPHAELDGEVFKNIGVLFKYRDIKEDVVKTSMVSEDESLNN